MDNKDGYITAREHGEFAQRMDSENKQLNARVDNMESTLNTLVVEQMTKMNGHIERMLIQIENVTKVQENHSKRLGIIENRDGEHWRNIIAYLITAGVGAAATLVLTQLGLK